MVCEPRTRSFIFAGSVGVSPAFRCQRGWFLGVSSDPIVEPSFSVDFGVGLTPALRRSSSNQQQPRRSTAPSLPSCRERLLAKGRGEDRILHLLLGLVPCSRWTTGHPLPLQRRQVGCMTAREVTPGPGLIRRWQRLMGVPSLFHVRRDTDQPGQRGLPKRLARFRVRVTAVR